MLTRLWGLFGGSSRAAAPLQCRRTFRPRLEPLEDRRVMSVAVIYSNMRAEILENAPQSIPQVPALLSLLRSNGSFSDLTYAGNTEAGSANYREHGWRLSTLGQAYHWDDPANPWFQDATLKSRIVQGFSYMASSVPSVTSTWWWKEIGVPNGFNDGLLLMRNELGSSLRDRILSKFYGTAWAISDDDGANLTYHAPAALTQGVLKNDTTRIKDVVRRVSIELSAYKGEGILQDLSFYQHGGKLNWHSGSYGMVFARDVAQVMRWTAGSAYAFGIAAVDQHLRYVLDHLAWMNRGKLLEPTSQGRSITRPGNIGEKAKTLRGIVLDMLPVGRRTDELLKFLDRIDSGVDADNALSGNKSLWRVDGMLHQREDFLAAVRMLSSRTLRPETADGQNTKGYFEGDGFTTLLKDGDEYGTPGGPEIYDAWDWQRLPGTTVEHNGIIPYQNMFSSTSTASGLSNLVGSASDGNYGVAMMDYRRYNVSVTARKSWFFFDDEMVALGADIDAAGALAPVFTSLNQVFLDGPITVADSLGSEQLLGLGQAATLSGPQWVHHDGMGYVFLQPPAEATVQGVLQPTKSGLELPVFSTWINHGAALLDGSYAYSVVAGKSAAEVAAYYQAQPIQILSNTASLQAVRHAGLAQTQAAFFAPGSLEIAPGLTVSVDQPVLLIVQELGDELQITVADPRKSLATVNIEVSRTVIGPGATWLADKNVTRIAVPLPAGGYAGSSVTATFVETAGPPVLLSAFQDAYVRNGTYANKNYGQAVQVGVQKQTGSNVRESFLQFDLANLPGEIAWATLKLTRVAGDRNAKVDLAPVASDAWSEQTLTWNTRPAADAKFTTVTSLKSKPVLFEITALVKDAAATDGLLSLKISAPASNTYWAGFGSDENATAAVRPVLEVYFKKSSQPLVLPEGEALDFLSSGAELDLLAADVALVYGPALPSLLQPAEEPALDLFAFPMRPVALPADGILIGPPPPPAAGDAAPPIAGTDEPDRDDFDVRLWPDDAT